MSSLCRNCSNNLDTQGEYVFSPLSYTLTCTSPNIRGIADISITGLEGMDISSTTDMSFLKMQLS